MSYFAKWLAFAAVVALVILGCVYSLDRAAHADITPVIMPTKPAAPTMITGATTRPTPDSDGYQHDPTVLATPSFAPAATAAPYGGMLG